MEPSVIAAARQGDRQAFAQIVAEFQTPIYNLAFRMLGNRNDAEDAAQETFLRAYSQIKTFDPSQNLATWLLSIAAHYCIDRLRRGQRFRWLSFDEPAGDQVAASLMTDEPTPEQFVLTREREEEVQQLLQKLPPAYRLVTVLRYWYDLPLEEIAKTTGDSLSSVKVKLFRARQMLAKQMGAGRTRPQRMELVSNA
jgi:RNA polymerase sigma-70 factor (ECF subfamily)